MEAQLEERGQAQLLDAHHTHKINGNIDLKRSGTKSLSLPILSAFLHAFDIYVCIHIP